MQKDLKEATAYRQQLRKRIMETALKAFMQYGIRAARMAGIASMLGISKRTLYEIYDDKEQLLYESIKMYDHQRRQHLTDFAAANHHVIDVILEVYRMKVEELRTVNPAFYTDILKYPKLAQYIRDNNERTREDFVRFMQRGVEDGYLRKSVNYELIPLMFDAIGHYVLDHELIRQYSIEELFSNLFLVALRGLCTQKGLRIIDEAKL